MTNKATTSKKTESKASTKNKDTVLRVSIPTPLKTWVVAQSKTENLTQGDFIAKVLSEAKGRHSLDFVDQIKDQIRVVVQDEIKKLRKGLFEALDKGRLVANRVAEHPFSIVKEFQKNH